MSVSQIREYAEMQRNRGHAYSLMKAGDKQANLKRAVACYEKALQLYTREQYPEEWAALHYDIGNTYQNLPAFASEKSTNLQEAITHYENALQEHILHDERWAIIHFRLGEAYYHLTTGTRQTNLKRAIDSFEQSLEVYTHKDFPAQWAMTHLCIGEALRNLPEGDQQTNRQIVFGSYQNALQVYTRQSFPKQWAMAQRSLGDLYFSIRYETRPHSYGNSRAYSPDLLPNLRDAILCYQGALQVYTRGEYPVEWAATLYALGNLYRSVRGYGQRDSLEQAIDCYQQVLQVYTLESAPLEWARTQWDLGDVYMSVAKYYDSSAYKLASACYEQAIKVYTQVDFPHEWAKLQKNLQSARDEQTEEVGNSPINTVSEFMEQSMMGLKNIIQPTYRRKPFMLLFAGIGADVIACIFIGGWLGQVAGIDSGWLGFFFFLVGSVGASYLFILSGNAILKAFLSFLIAAVWGYFGYVFATSIGTGTQIKFLPDSIVISVLFLVGSLGLHLYLTFRRK